MCRENDCAHLSLEEGITAEEGLLIYCKPVELYNILHRRSRHNPSFLQRCLHYKLQARRRRRLRSGIVIFNYRDYNNILQKTEVTKDFCCPFCSMHCASYKGVRYHLCSSHDLFNFEFWVTEEYQAVNVSVKTDMLTAEQTITDGLQPWMQTFFFSSKRVKCKLKKDFQNEKHVQFLELDSSEPARDGTCMGFLENGEKASKSFPSEKHFQNCRHGIQNNDSSDYPSSWECAEHVESSFTTNVGVSVAMHQSSPPECIKSQSGIDRAISSVLQSSKTRKLTLERSDPKNRVLLQKRQFFHSHRVQHMALDQVLSDRDSEDEVDDEIADFEDRRMLDDFVDVAKDEKHLMHLWNSLVRKQRVLADGHVPWACEAFSKLHGQELKRSPALYRCWRLFLIKLWNHGLLDACTMNNCNKILETFQTEGSEAKKS